MEERSGVGGEELAVAAGAAEAHSEVLGGVVGCEGVELEPVVKAREERSISPEGEAISQLGQPDEDEREERAAVPFVIEEDMQVIERVLVEKVGLVEEKHWMHALPGEVLDHG